MISCDLRIDGRVMLDRGLVGSGSVLVSNGRVVWSGRSDAAPTTHAPETLELDSYYIVPGYIDLHVHGARGADVVDGSADALATICRAHAEHGTTSLCATILTSPTDVTLRALEVVAAATSTADDGAAPDGARVLGAHLEGPFINPERAGAQPREHIRAPDRVLLDELLAAAGGTLRIMTIAPELDGAMPLIERLVDAGVVVSMGHSAATYEQALAAVDAGARAATHLFNAMPPLHHREVGLVGAVLSQDQVTAELIADGVHVSEPMLQLLWRIKRLDHLALVTDCTAALDAPPGGARLGDRPVEVRDGSARFADGTLAGSVLTMEDAVINLVQLAQAPLAGAVAAASRVPARLLGLGRNGSLSVGRAADIAVLDRDLRVRAVFVGGKHVAGEVPEF